MNRLQEINDKHEQLKKLLEQNQADGLWLRRTRNLAWITAGADASIPLDSETGMYSVLITADRRTVYTSNIEATRLRAEDQLQDLGFDYVEFPWQVGGAPDPANLIHDLEPETEASIQQVRWVLTTDEQERYRALGKDAAAAIESVARSVQKGETEFDIAARLDLECKRRGGVATVNLIASDERIAQFRHPLATMKRVEKVVMIVVCMRRGGLIVAATRFAHIGAVPAQLQAQFQKVAAIDAAVIAASRPGQTLGDVFADLQAAYNAQGERDQWKLHHQGGLIGYIGREQIATPHNPTLLQAGQALAWNPSLVGVKSEDTILINAKGFEIITAGDFPALTIEVAGQRIARPGIVEV